MEITSRISLTGLPQNRKEIESAVAEAVARIFAKYPAEQVSSMTIEARLTRESIKIDESDEVKS